MAAAHTTSAPAAASRDLTARARAAMPGGVNSPVRAWNGVGGEPLAVAHAAGPSLTDVQGRAYVDLVCSWGAGIVGHAHPVVIQAVQRASERGLSYGATTEGEIALAEEIGRRYPPAQKVRLVSTGTEATMTALRLARGATGRDLIVKFAGCYHGHSDALLVEAGSGLATAGAPSSAGVPAQVAALTRVLPYGDVEALREAFATDGSRIAAVIVEAAPANMGVVAPPPGFNALIAGLCREAGAVMICDEVLTGFRVGPAGWWGVERDVALAAGEQPWVPDLVTFGKVIGGGLPVAAVAGRADLMDQLAPLGGVYQAGTLSGNPVAVAAGLATLSLLDGAAYAHLDALAEALADGVSSALAERGVLGRAGNLMSPFLGLETAPVTFDQASSQDTGAYASLFHALNAAGVWAPPSAFEAWFLSTAHSLDDVETVVGAVEAWARS